MSLRRWDQACGLGQGYQAWDGGTGRWTSTVAPGAGGPQGGRGAPEGPGESRGEVAPGRGL